MVMDLHASSRSALAPRNLREFKMVVLGPRKVGKSALVVRFLTRRFINEYLENADMTCNGVVDVDGETLRVNIQDTSEKGMRLSSIDQHLRWADAIMLVYSVTDADSFRQLRDTATKIAEKVNEVDEKEISRVPPLLLVGNKCDLDFAAQVSRQEAYELAEQLHCDYYETSAREGWSKHITKPYSSLSLYANGDATTPTNSSPLGLGLVTKSAHVTHSSSQSERRGSKGSLGHLRSRSSYGVRGEINGNCIKPTVNISEAPKSDSGSPSPSEEDSDDGKAAVMHRLALPKSKKSRFGQTSLIGRLSPRLGRKIYKTDKPGAQAKQGKQSRSNSRTLMNGLSSTLFAAGTPVCREFSSSASENGHHLSSSSSSGSCTSTAGSTESLVSCGLDSDNSPSAVSNRLVPPVTIRVESPKEDDKASTGGSVSLSAPSGSSFRDHEFCLGEPFLHLCRDGKTLRNRQRARSPSHLLRSGFKRIKSLKVDGHHLQVNHTLRALPN